MTSSSFNWILDSVVLILLLANATHAKARRWETAAQPHHCRGMSPKQPTSRKKRTAPPPRAAIINRGGTPERTRTSGLLLRRQALYPLSYGRMFPAHKCTRPSAAMPSLSSPSKRAPGVAALATTGYHSQVNLASHCVAVFLLAGGSMTSRDGVPGTDVVRLNEEDLTYLMNVLRNATQPVTTQQLIDVLRRQPGQFHIETQAPSSSLDASPEATH